jgi:DNA polymerase V
VKKGKVWLQPENSDYKAIEIKEDNELVIWGIVTNVIKKL